MERELPNDTIASCAFGQQKHRRLCASEQGRTCFCFVQTGIGGVSGMALLPGVYIQVPYCTLGDGRGVLCLFVYIHTYIHTYIRSIMDMDR